MKTRALILLASLFLSPSVFAQGTVAFANTSTTLIQTNANGNTGPIAPAGAYRIGLYVGPLGTLSNNLAFVGVAMNSAVPGRFDGGNPFVLPSGGLFDGSAPISFQVRAWSSAGGSTYEEALFNSAFLPNILLGQSTVGFVTPNPSGSPSPTPPLFGTGPGQVSGFFLGVPEPSTYALGALGAVLAALFSRNGSRRK